MKVYIGYDPSEATAAHAAAKSLEQVTGGELRAEFLRLPKLRDHGFIWRTFDRRGGQGYDLTGNETFSTEFKFTRFLVPMLCQGGRALFLDCDMVFLRDPREMLDTIKPGKAVWVVKHDYTPAEQFKMVGLRQTSYFRKNWSSVMLFDTDHSAHRRLTLRDVNERSALDLHSFYWLHDDEIGELGPEWNWLVDVQPRPENLGIAHMTLGGPWLPGWQGGSFDDEWRKVLLT